MKKFKFEFKFRFKFESKFGFLDRSLFDRNFYLPDTLVDAVLSW